MVGIDLTTGEPMDPVAEGIYDSFRVIRNTLASSSSIASNLLLWYSTSLFTNIHTLLMRL